MKPLILLLSILAIVWAGFGVFIWYGPYWDGMAERGQFGDLFGADNALFSGLAFGGVIYAIFLQRNELSLQRRELSLTRVELRKAAEAQERSHEALAEQGRLQALSATLSAYDSLVGASMRTESAVKDFSRRSNSLPSSKLNWRKNWRSHFWKFSDTK